MGETMKALEEFGIALGKLRKVYAEEFGGNPNNLLIIADEQDYVTILPNNECGTYLQHFREWVDIK